MLHTHVLHILIDNTSLHQLKSIHFHTFLYTYIFFFTWVILFVYYHIIFHISSLSFAFYTILSSSVMFFVLISNGHFHHQEVSLYTVTHVIMITTIHLWHYHQLRHKVIQQNVIQLTKRQWMIFYKICRLQKKQNTSNTNNSIQVNLNNKQSWNNCLVTASNKINDNNVTFDNLNYKYTPIM